MAIRVSNGERLGHWFGRRWRACARCEHRVAAWFVERGLSADSVNTLLRVAKLVAFGLLLYVAFWCALVLAFAVACAWVIRNGTVQEEPEPEWRIGLSGYGLYRGDVRIHFGSPDDDD